MRRLKFLIVLCALAAFPLLVAWAQTPRLSVDISSEIDLSELDFVWAEDMVQWKDFLVVSDLGRSSLYFLSLEGRKAAGAPALPSKIQKPGLARANGDLLLVEDRQSDSIHHLGETMLYLGERGQGSSLTEVLPAFNFERVREGFLIDRVYNWMPLAKGYLVFADFQRADSGPKDNWPWDTGFAFVSDEGQAGTFRTLYSLGERFSLRDWYVYTSHHIEVVDGVGYFLAPGPRAVGGAEVMGVYAFEPGGDQEFLGAVPDLYATVPNLDVRTALVAAKQGALRGYYLMQQIERLPAAAMGLYQKDNALYLLTKEKLSEGYGRGAARWSLLNVARTNTGLRFSADQSYTLPTTSPHLLLAAKDDGSSWLTIEKGPTTRIGGSAYNRTGKFAAFEPLP